MNYCTIPCIILILETVACGAIVKGRLMKSEAKNPTKLFFLMIALSPPVAFAQSPAAHVVAGDPTPQIQESGQQPENELQLVCEGSTSTSHTTAFVMDGQGHMALGSATSTNSARVMHTIRIHIVGDMAEVHIPTSLAPQISSKNGGWRKVSQLQINSNEIIGKVQVDWLDSTTFRIDRRTGSITSAGGFSGTCRKEDLQKRVF